MDDKFETAGSFGQTPLSRRTIATGIAWGVPALTVLGTAPAFAASGDTVTFTSVVVNTPPTGAPNVFYINISNKDSTITLGGTATVGAVVTVTATGGAWSDTAVRNGDAWSAVVPAGALPDGTYTFTASVEGPPKVTATGPSTVTKDTVAPTVDATTAVISTNNQNVTISGTMSEAGTVVVSTNPSLDPFTYSYPTSTTWQAVSTQGKNDAYTGTVVATDVAGNTSASDSFFYAKDSTGTFSI